MEESEVKDKDLLVDLLLIDNVLTIKKMKDVRYKLDNNQYKDPEPFAVHLKGLHVHVLCNMLDILKAEESAL